MIETALDRLRALEAKGALGTPPPATPGDEHEKMYIVAQMLCEEGNFLQAAPLAMSLAINTAFDARFYFLTGRAFQRLGVYNVAATFYQHAMRNGESALPMYRLAECFAGMNRGQEAIEHFDKAFELGREDAQYRKIQDSAMTAIDRIRRQSGKKG
ncbi:hypothetical protein [Caenimonas sp. SL110]|uniref:hypothetical protein n=1 Tax=Caenimonas sp. SL110 TaxID=1450524 RepID=UPI00065304BA|nr:hypothetical protein [Caenimonas sp. SL110]